MVVISEILVQGVQMLLVLLLAPLLTGFVRKVKARLVRRQGAAVFQPYRDLLRLLRKEVVLADNASWLFRVTPYVTFAAIWVAAALVPTFATGLLFNWTADLIAIVALLGSARFFLALAGMDVGTSFGGIGAGDALDRVLHGARCRLDATLDGRELHGLVLCRPAGVAGHGCDGADHGGAGRERADSGRQSGHASRAHHGA
jgi:hypothetical protein